MRYAISAGNPVLAHTRELTVKILNFKQLLMAATLTLAGQASAEDIDLFLGMPPSIAGAPNVLIILDNTGNWTSPFNVEKAALVDVFNGLEDEEINVGLMMFTETGGGDSNTDGGYIRAAIRPMDVDDNAEDYANMIDEFHVRGDKSNSGKAGLAMAEAYHYYKGLAPHAGNRKNKSDWGVFPGTSNTYNQSGGNSSCCSESQDVWALSGNALDSKNGSPYNSPVDPTSCAKNYIIYISNGAVQDSNSDNRQAETLLTAQSGDTTQISISPSGSADVVADEWARFMKQSVLDITTYTVDIDPVTTGQGPGWSALLKSMADESGGSNFVAGSTDLENIIKEIISEILAVNSVFASVALPASSNAQSTFLNRVYIGQFRPDENVKPRWPGNLKQYKLGLDGTEVKVLDAVNDPVIAEGTQTGFIQNCATSFWTPSTADTYWDFNPQGECSDTAKPSNTPDGPIVEKGGQAYTVRESDPDDRKIYTCSSSMSTCASTATMTRFNNANTIGVTGALLDPNNPLDASDRTDAINWGRGMDLFDENGDSDTTDMRASVHGDIIHSRPVAVNYGTDDTPEIVVYYGGNDGMLRAINGNRTASYGSPAIAAGYELWAFMPPEFYPYIKRIGENSVLVSVPGSGAHAGTQGAAKPYGMDGPITALEFTDGVDDMVYIYAGMRRSARIMYAFDVSDPDDPEMLWKLGCPDMNDDSSCTGAPGYTSDDFSKLGQTWSAANVFYAASYFDGDGVKPMLIMGGGYDDCEDTDNDSDANHSCNYTTGAPSTHDKGNIIYVLDAETGQQLASFATDRAVVGEIRVVTVTENSPLVSYAYAADTGGNIYRISAGTAGSTSTPGAPTPIGTEALNDWVISKIAALGCDGDGEADVTCDAPRKFMFGPDVVRIPGSDNYGILIGSGDREKPLVAYGAANTVQNYFFSLVDQPANAASWMDVDGDCTYDQMCLAMLTDVGTGADFDPDTVVNDHGFKLPLASGEQVVSGALTIADIANFSTHIPSDPNDFLDPNSPDFCANNLGTATTYNVSYKDAAGDTVNIIGGGLVPTPVAGKVILDDGTIVPFCIGCGGDNSAIGGSSVGSGVTWIQPKSRVYWNIQQ